MALLATVETRFYPLTRRPCSHSPPNTHRPFPFPFPTYRIAAPRPRPLQRRLGPSGRLRRHRRHHECHRTLRPAPDGYVPLDSFRDRRWRIK